VVPGEWLLADEPIEINAGRRTLRVSVRNTGDRPIQVGSHFHFFEVNRALDFDRPATLGMRLDVPAGQAIRFEAGDEREVDLVEFGGLGRVIGFNNLVDGGRLDQRSVQRALEKAARLGFAGMPDRAAGSQS
jgi:urease beta subunit